MQGFESLGIVNKNNRKTAVNRGQEKPISRLNSAIKEPNALTGNGSDNKSTQSVFSVTSVKIPNPWRRDNYVHYVGFIHSLAS